jgi:hypothetical protein
MCASLLRLWRHVVSVLPFIQKKLRWDLTGRVYITAEYNDFNVSGHDVVEPRDIPSSHRGLEPTDQSFFLILGHGR